MEHLAPLIAAVAKEGQSKIDSLEADNFVTIRVTGADETAHGSSRLRLFLGFKVVARGGQNSASVTQSRGRHHM